MVQIVKATEIKTRFGEYSKRTYASGEHFIVERGGMPIVAIVPLSDYRRIMPKNAKPELRTAVQTGSDAEQNYREFLAFLKAHYKTLPPVDEEEAELDVQEAIRAVRMNK